MGAGLLRRAHAHGLARSGVVLVLVSLPTTAGMSGAASAESGGAVTRVADGAAPLARAAAVKRCKRVRVKVKRDGKIVKRDGRPVYRKVRRCKKNKGMQKRCRTVRVKKRTKSGRVVKRNGKPVYVKRRKCKPPGQKPAPEPAPHPTPQPERTPPPTPQPEPTPQPGRPGDLANRVLAMAPRAPGNVDLFSSTFENDAQGLYPSGSAMVPAAGPPPTAQQVRDRLTAYLTAYFGAGSPRIAEALAVFDDPDLKALTDGDDDADATLRAAVAGLTGTVLEPTIDHLLDGSDFILIRFGALPTPVPASTSGGNGSRVITFHSRHEADDFRYMIGTMGHELLHADTANSGAEEVLNNALTAMAYLQVLASSPGLAHAGTEYARVQNTEGMIIINSREAGSPDSEIYAPTGVGVAPGSPFNAADYWTIRGGSSSSAAPATLRAILENALAPGTPIPATPDFSQATAELFEQLGDDWLSDVQRVQVSVLLQLVSVDEIAQAIGLAQQQIIDTLELQPYLDAIN